MNKINICSIGDPKDPKTWSGTPYNIYTEILKRNYCNEAFSSELDSLSERILLKLSRLFFLKSANSDRAFIQRLCRAYKVNKLSGGFPTLHMGSLDLPYLFNFKRYHYLYCDSTWNLWNSQSREENTSGIVKFISEYFEKKSYNQVKHIFTISEYVKKNLIEHYNISADKITVVGTGLGVISPFCGSKNYENHKVLFAAKGRFKDKGGDLVIKAFKKVVEVIPDATLTIVGQNEYTNMIREKNITAHGFISVEKLQDIFNTHSLFLMPAYNEPWGLVYLEAMSCKMPVIGLNRNSFPEISGYGKYGFGLDSDNPDELADLIIRLLHNPKSLEEIGIAAQEYCINKFTWQNVADKILTQIEKIEA